MFLCLKSGALLAIEINCFNFFVQLQPELESWVEKASTEGWCSSSLKTSSLIRVTHRGVASSTKMGGIHPNLFHEF